MLKDVKCPYCKEWLEVNQDDGFGCEQDKLEEMECYKCRKIFTFMTSIIFHYESNKADCLNGGEHKYKKTTTFPKYMTRWKCEDCEDEKPLDFNDPDKYKRCHNNKCDGEYKILLDVCPKCGDDTPF